MDSGRPPPPPNRTLTTTNSSSTTSELFICFTSRLSSSSSMKISKSILSPGRAARDPPISLSTSLSRRLRTSGSIKGGASPAMFPTTGKKRGCGFENPEPSSPKVTCIGQVRVKSKKKQGKKLRTLSRRHSTGEVSFRKLEHIRDGFSSQNQNQHQSQNLGSNYQPVSNNQECLAGQRNNNQRWVHLPLTICEALRAFGSEFSCLFPCRSSCFSTTDREKEAKMAAEAAGSGEGEGNRQSSCGAAFARWLVALQDGDGGGARCGGREIELVVGGDEDEDEEEKGVRYSRRHVFEDLQIVNDTIQGKDEARVSICIPPKNALLLMRCRSDPMKMEALANRLWEPSVAKNDEEDEEFLDEEDELEDKTVNLKEDLEVKQQKVEEKFVVIDEVNQVLKDVLKDEAKQDEEERNLEMEITQSIYMEEENQQQSSEITEEEKEETEAMHLDEEIAENEEESMFLWSLFEEFGVQDHEIQGNEACSDTMENGKLQLTEALEIETEESNSEIETEESNSESAEKHVEEKMVTQFAERSRTSEEKTHEVLERESQAKEKEEERESSSRMLPECLLLMMCEPKLSMEVSKETWVCSTDFIRRPSDRKRPPPRPPVKSVDGQDTSKVSPPTATTTTTITSSSTVVDNDPMGAAAVQQQQVLTQPRRLSCSLPAPPSMAAMLEQKLVNAVGYEPFVLTRCKSEPMRTAAAKLVPDTCFWKNRKLEPLRRATFGVSGAAGLGF